MAKKKSKLKKIAGALAAGLGAAALMGRRNRNRQMNEYLATEGGDKGSTFVGTPDNRGNTAEMFNFKDAFSYMPMKKGGRVGVGKAKRGFGRAMKGKK